jgi:hypothetical protein
MNRMKIALALITGLLMASPAFAQTSYYLLVPQNPGALSGHMQAHKVDNGMATKPIPMVVRASYATRAQCEQARNNTAMEWRKAHVSTQQWNAIGIPSQTWMFQCMASNDPRLTAGRASSHVVYLAPQQSGSHSQYCGTFGSGVFAGATGAGAVPPPATGR